MGSNPTADTHTEVLGGVGDMVLLLLSALPSLELLVRAFLAPTALTTLLARQACFPPKWCRGLACFPLRGQSGRATWSRQESSPETALEAGASLDRPSSKKGPRE